MIISRVNKFGVKLQQGDVTIAVNNFGFGDKMKAAKLKPTISISSLSHGKVNSADIGDDAFVVSGPGQYEYSSVSIQGALSKTDFPEEGMNNTVYRIEFVGMTIGVLGFVSKPEQISETVRTALPEADIVIVPLGTGLAPSEAYTAAKSLMPSYIIPVGDIDDKIVGPAFLNEAGADKTKPEGKLVITPKDLIGKENVVVHLSV